MSSMHDRKASPVNVGETVPNHEINGFGMTVLAWPKYNDIERLQEMWRIWW